MFGFFFKKERRLKSLIFEYLDALQQTKSIFEEAIGTCLVYSDGNNFDFLMERTHKFESRADDIFDEINNMMYGKALIPESRADIMGLLDMVETLPRLWERVLYLIHTQGLIIPDFLTLDTRELVRVSLECCDMLNKQITSLFEQQQGIRGLLAAIDANESHCDHIQRRMAIKLFKSDEEPFIKLQLRELIERLGEISDRALWIARRVNILSMTRRV
jgi:predicted phosphate transport protein (TIGR00153 family)